METAAITAGTTAETHPAEKGGAYALRDPGGYEFTPRGRVLWPPMLRHVCAPEPSGAPCRRRITMGAQVEDALRRLNIALSKGNDFLFRANLHAFYRAACQHPTRGTTVPHTIEV